MGMDEKLYIKHLQSRVNFLSNSGIFIKSIPEEKCPKKCIYRPLLIK